MKFCSKLSEAILLKRTIKFLAEVVLLDKKRQMIRCPNLGALRDCDILGTRVWFSKPLGYHCLPTWELSEIDGGNLVCINPEYILPLVIDAINNSVILELSGCSILHSSSKLQYPKYHTLVLQRNKRQCYVAMEPVTLSNKRGGGYFPDIQCGGIDNIEYLTKIRQEGHQAVLLYCAMNTAINSIIPAVHIDAKYREKLANAIAAGVEVIAYKTDISLQGLQLSSQIPVHLVEGISYNV